MKTLTISLPADRAKLGTAEIDGQMVLLGVLKFTATTYPVLGKADNEAAMLAHNPTRHPLWRFGDTPLGTYRGTVVGPGLDVHAFGPGKRILLVPVSGDCLQAEKNGRSGIMCHGGDPNPAYVQWGGLRPTDGCVRFSNEHIALVIEAVGADELTVEIQLLNSIKQFEPVT